MGIIEELEWRGLISDCTDREGLAQRLAKGAVTLYCGFDPTADSLHVGSLVPLLALRRFQQFGHKPIVIAGGATGSIGDPSGKSAERQLLTHEQLKANIEGVKKQLASFLDFDSEANAALLVDNADWTAPLSFATSASISRSTPWWPRRACARGWRIAMSASASPSSAT
jgi:tyrosyl-tRNA synthetase